MLTDVVLTYLHYYYTFLACVILHFDTDVTALAGECILRVWQHSSVLQPCKCPICRRAITLLIPSEVSEAEQQDPEVERIQRDLAKYNRIFGGGPVSFMQVILLFQCFIYSLFPFSLHIQNVFHVLQSLI